jgi:hypothetical protein
MPPIEKTADRPRSPGGDAFDRERVETFHARAIE